MPPTAPHVTIPPLLVTRATRVRDRALGGPGDPGAALADACSLRPLVIHETSHDRLDGKPAQAIAIKGDPDSPVIFHLRLGDGLAPKVIEHEPAPDALGAPLVAISAADDTLRLRPGRPAPPLRRGQGTGPALRADRRSRSRGCLLLLELLELEFKQLVLKLQVTECFGVSPGLAVVEDFKI